jgi:hypothetical protein
MSDVIEGVEWNELLLVSYQKGQMRLWAGWKRNLSAFMDPRLWEDSEAWEGYFRPLPEGTPWGVDGYGLVFMDLDAKKAWSVNDYSHPGYVELPEYQALSVRDHTVGRAALREMMNHPRQWDQVVFSLAKTGLKECKIEQKTLSEVVEGVGGFENLASIATRGGILRLSKTDYMLMGGEYEPAGWACLDVRGRGDLEVLLPLLEHARGLGLPRPDPALVDEFVRDQIKLEWGEEPEGEGAELQAQFDALLTEWPARPVAPSKKPGVPR